MREKNKSFFQLKKIKYWWGEEARKEQLRGRPNKNWNHMHMKVEEGRKNKAKSGKSELKAGYDDGIERKRKRG